LSSTGGEMIKVMGIMGSPRRHGNTERLLDEVLAGARAAGAGIEKVIVSELDISPCREIYACLKDGNCAIADDMQQLYPKLTQADGIVLASPIFFYGLTSQAKAVVDRCQALWVRRHILGIASNKRRSRKGVFVSVGATGGKRLFSGAKSTVKCFFDAVGVEYTGELLIRRVDAKGEIARHPTALRDAFKLGGKLVSSVRG